jgi:hypothetical protein
MAVVTVGQSIVPKGKTLISTTAVTAGVSSIAISSIPQIYTDLFIVWKDIIYSAYTGATSTSIVRFNADSTSGNYRWNAHSTASTVAGDSAAASSTTGTSWGDPSTSSHAAFQGRVANEGQWGEILIYNYSSSQPKQVNARYFQGTGIGRHSFTTGSYIGSAVTSINITPSVSFTYTSGTILLYGVV